MSTHLLSILALPLLRARSSRFSTRRISWGVRVLCGVLAVAWLLHAPGLAAKQKAPTTETVSGLVTDKAENRISGATVTLKDLQTGKTEAIYSEADGQYKFSDLDPHHDYQIQSSFDGVSSESRQILFQSLKPSGILAVIEITPSKGASPCLRFGGVTY